MIFSNILKNKYLYLLLAISLISHWYVFFDIKTLNWGDWVYYFNSQAQTTLGFTIYYSPFNFGSVGTFPNNWVFYALFYVISHFGISWEIFTRLFFIIPTILLTPLFSFLLFKKLFGNELPAFFSACIFTFNTFFLKIQSDWITYAFIWWVFPALFLSTLYYLETKKNKYLIYNALLVALGIVYEIRIMILVLVFLTLFQIVYVCITKNNIKEKIRDNTLIFTSFGIGILMHSFWIIPIITKLGKDIITSASPTPFVSYYDILDAFTLHAYNWSNNLAFEPFIKQSVEFRHFLIPLLAFIGIVFFNKIFKNKEKYIYFVFFAISLLIFIFLGKQEFKPLTSVYGWLFYHIPLFNLYRESGKFFILIALSSSFFYGLGLFYIYQLIKNYSKKLSLLVIILILFFSSIYNLQHFVDQKIDGMVKGRTINEEYFKLEDTLSKDPNPYRILWMPIKPRFGFFSDTHPFVNATDLLYILKNQVSFIPFGEELPIQSQLLYLLKQNYSQTLFDTMGIKYIVVPIAEERIKKISSKHYENVMEIFEYYGDRETFVSELDNISWIKKIDISTKDLVVYENLDYKETFFSFSKLYNFNSTENLVNEYELTAKLDKNFYFVSGTNGESITPLVKITNLFENTVLENNAVTDRVSKNNHQSILFTDFNTNTHEDNLFLNGSKVSKGFVDINKDINLFEYKDPKYDFKNIIPNPSFEESLWQDKVGDCHNFDENPIIAMGLNKEEKSDGKQSLELEATRHNACTIIDLDIVANSSYLFSFDYQSPNARQASFYLDFNDKDASVIKETLEIKDENWNTFSRTIKIPEGATHVSLYVYADSTDGITNIINRYDNFKLIAIPDVSNKYYLVSDPRFDFKEPKSMTFDFVNPTKKLVHIKGATTPFYLGMSESYNPQWQIQFNNEKINGFFESWTPFVKLDKIGEEYHHKLNNFLNAWYIDVDKYCSENNLCIKNADGSYDMELVTEFFPMRWFYLGLLISGTIFAFCIGYLGYYALNKRRNNQLDLETKLK